MTLFIDGDDVGCKVHPDNDDSTNADIEVLTDLSPNSILSELIPDYHIGSHSIQISDFSNLDEKSRTELFINLNKQDIGGRVNADFFDSRVTDVKIENLPLRASDATVAARWMSELRRYWWKDEFVDVERARIDQEYWSVKLLGMKEPELIIEGDELLKELQDSDAFWGVASMLDLMPDSDMRTPFYISEDDDYNDRIVQRIFSDINYKNLKRIVLIDSYPGRGAESILRSWMKNDSVEIVFLVNSQRYTESNNRLESKDLRTNSRIVMNDMDKKKAHSRFIVFVDRHDEFTIWNVDNSLSSFKYEDGKVTTTASMKFTPESYFNDKELEKIVRGL